MAFKVRHKSHLLKMVTEGYSHCVRCEIGEHCRHHVFIDTIPKTVLDFGNNRLHYLFIGEAPGVTEDITGFPFTGPAGDLLRKAIDLSGSVECPVCCGVGKCKACWGYGRLTIGLTNLIACRPYEDPKNPRCLKNREPDHIEVMNCMERLLDTIIAFNPLTLVFLGNVAQSYMWTIREQLEVRGMTVRLEKLLHPSFILRRGGLDYNHKYVDQISSMFHHYWDCWHTEGYEREYKPPTVNNGMPIPNPNYTLDDYFAE